LKRFNGLLLVGLLASLLAFTNCDNKKSDNSTAMLLLLAGMSGTSSNGSITFTDDTLAREYTWQSGGFEQPGSGIYSDIAGSPSGTGSFFIILSSGHVSGTTYSQAEVDVFYTDTSGTMWTTDDGHSFSLTLGTWPGIGGKITGIFSGTLQVLAGATHRTISNGSFNIKVTN
jgi:hypothetical protein